MVKITAEADALRAASATGGGANATLSTLVMLALAAGLRRRVIV